MIKKLFFSSLKGGTGKTTLAIHFCNFLHFYMKKKVILISNDFQKSLSFLAKECPYPILEPNILELKTGSCLHPKYDDYDFAVYDLLTLENSIPLDLFAMADFFVIPFEFHFLDLIKCFGLAELLIQKKIINENQLIFIPNRQDRYKNDDVKTVFDKQFKEFNLHKITPQVALSNHLRSINFLPPSARVFYLLRPTFISTLRYINN